MKTAINTRTQEEYDALMEAEEWKDIEGYEGLYKVSSLGRVKSFHQTYKEGADPIDGKLLSAGINTQGYYVVVLFKRSRKPKTCTVHRLVASAFIPNPESKRCINHKNGIRHDNRLENMEWATYSENLIHAYDVLGRIKPTKASRKANSNKAVAVIGKGGEIINVFLGYSLVQSVLGLKEGTVSRCIKTGYRTKKEGYVFKEISKEQYKQHINKQQDGI